MGLLDPPSYLKPSAGIPATDLTTAAQNLLAAAGTAYQKPGTGIPSTDLATAVQALLNAAGTAYQKPGAGIPATDLTAAAQALLAAAGTGYQKPSSGVPGADLAAPLGWGICKSGGHWYLTSSPQASQASAIHGNGNLRLTSWYLPNSVTLDRLAVETTVAGETGSTFRFGIYADNGACYPGALVFDGSTAVDGTTGYKSLTVSQALTAGLYWIGGAVQNAPTTQPTLRCMGSTAPPAVPMLDLGGGTSPTANVAPQGYAQGSVTGSLPGTFTTTIATVNSGVLARVLVRTA